jgi:hypothetical protein
MGRQGRSPSLFPGATKRDVMPAEGGYTDRSGPRRDFQNRQGQQNKRMRGRNRKGPNPLTRSYESNGPDVKIRGTALHIAEKYMQLARDAQSSGDRVAGESYLQHAEHYYRIVAAAQAQLPPGQQVFRSDEEGDEEEDRDPRNSNNTYGDRPQIPQASQPAFGLADPQPYLNGNGQPVTDDETNRPATPEENQDRDNPARAEGGQQGDPGGRGQRGDFRSRRRRQYRDRYNPEGDGDGAQAPAASPVVEAPPGDD